MFNKIELVNEKTLIIGIDIAKKIHWARFTNSRGITIGKPFKIENTAEGMANLSVRISELIKEYSCTSVLMGFEPSGHYWRTLAWYFKTTEGITLVGVNPYHVKQLKELEDNTQTKNDQKDALVIAHLIRDGRFFEIYMPDDDYAELRILRRHREQMSVNRKRIINNIYTLMDEYFPEYESIGFSYGSPSSNAILRATPFPTDILSFTPEELWKEWKSHSNLQRTRIPKKLAVMFIETAEKSIGVGFGLSAARLKLNDLLDQIELLNKQIDNCDEMMSQIISRLDIEKYMISVPGVGKVIAASFIAETGDLNRFSDWKQVRKLAGLNLVEQSSGQHKGKTTISKRGRPDLRRIIYIIGDKGMLVSTEMMEFYQYLRHRPNNQLKHDQAVLAVGLKLMRILFHVVKHRELYDPKKALGEYRISQIANAA